MNTIDFCIYNKEKTYVHKICKKKKMYVKIYSCVSL